MMIEIMIFVFLFWCVNCVKIDIFFVIVRVVREFGGKIVVIVDGDGMEVDYKIVLCGVFVFGFVFGKKFKKDEIVGIMLFMGVGVVIVFCVVFVFGCLFVMFNFIVGVVNIKFVMKVVKIIKIVMVYKFVELGGFELLIVDFDDVFEFIYFEDVCEVFGLMDKVVGGFGLIFLGLFYCC